MVQVAGVPLIEAVRMASETPARIMKIEKKGTLSKGNDADVVIFDENVHIATTIVNGKIVHTHT